MPTIAELLIRITGDPSSGLDTLRQTDAAIGDFSARSTAALSRVGDSLRGMFSDSISQANNYNSMLVTIQNTTGMTNQQTAQMGDTIRSMARDSGASLEQLGQAYFHIASLGYQGADATNILNAAMQSAVATGGNVSGVANTLAAAMREFGIQSDYAGRAMDVLMRSAAQGNMTLDQLVTGGARSIAMAGTLGDTLTDVGTVLADLSRHGFPSVATASTQVVGIFNSLIKPSQQAQAEIKSLSQTTGVDLVHDFGEFAQAAIGSKGLVGILKDIQAATGNNNEEVLKLIGNMRGGVGALALTGAGFSDLNSIQQQNIQAWDLGGQTVTAYQNRLNTANQQLAIARSNIRDAAISVGSELTPATVAVTQVLDNAARSTADFAREHSTLSAAVVSGAGVIGVGIAALETYQRIIRPVTQDVAAFVSSSLSMGQSEAAAQAEAAQAENARAASLDRLTAALVRNADAMEVQAGAAATSAGAAETTAVAGGAGGAVATSQVALYSTSGEALVTNGALAAGATEAAAAETALGTAATGAAAGLGAEAASGGILSGVLGGLSTAGTIAAASLGPIAIGATAGVAAYAIFGKQIYEWLGLADQTVPANKAMSDAHQANAKAITDEVTAMASAGGSQQQLIDYAKEQKAASDASAKSFGDQADAMIYGLSKQQRQAVANGETYIHLKSQEDEAATSSVNWQRVIDRVTDSLAAQKKAADALGSTPLVIPQGDIQAAGAVNYAAAYQTVTQAADRAGQSEAAAAAFQAQWTQAQKDAALAAGDAANGTDDYQSRLAELDGQIKSGDDSTKAYATSQRALDEAVVNLGPVMADHALRVAEVAQHQKELNQAWSDASGPAGSVQSMLSELSRELGDASVSAGTLEQHLQDLFSKPTQEQLGLRAQVADLDSQIANFQSRLANSSPALQAVANLQKIADQGRITGASADQQKKAQDDLTTAIAATASIGGKEVAAGQQQVDILGRQRDALSAQEKALGAGNQALAARTQAAAGTAAKESDLTTAADNAASHFQTGAGTINTATGVLNTQTSQSLDQFHTTVTVKMGAAGTDGMAQFTLSITNGKDGANAAAADAGTSAAASLSTAFGSHLRGSIESQLHDAFAGAMAGAQGQVASGASAVAPFAGSYPVTQGYGPSDLAAEPAYGGYPHFHEGIDYGVPFGTTVQAVAQGKVLAAGYGVVSPGQGNSIVLDLGNGLEAIYSHLSEIDVAAGQIVSAGQAIGLSGNSGTATTGAHLHFQVDVNGQPVDPATLNQLLAAASGTTPAGAQASAAPSTTLNGGLSLPPAWLAAIQANESTLPLPGAAGPQPMFGIVSSSRAVGQGTFSSQATDTSLGVGPGQTRQALFPSTAAGVAAFNDIWQQWPDAVAAAQRGDFQGFLQALAAHGYAGPSGGVWPGQVLSHYNPQATLPGYDAGAAAPSSAPGAAGQVTPSPFGPAYTAPSAAASAGAQAKDQAQADQQLQSITDQYVKLEGAVQALNQIPTPAALRPDADAFVASMSQIQGAYDRVQAATKAYNDAVAAGVSGKDLQDLRDQLTAAQTDWRALQDQASHALTQMQTDEQQLATATADQSTAEAHLGQVTGSRFQAHAAEAKLALQAELDADTRLVNDIQNHVTPAQIEADRIAAESARKAAQTYYDAWHNAMEQTLAAQREVASAQQALASDTQAITDEANLNAADVHRAATAATLASDVDASQQKQQAALTALATVKADDSRYAADAKALQDDITNNATQDAIARAQAAVDSDKEIRDADRQTADAAVAESKRAADAVKQDRASIAAQAAAQRQIAQDIKPIQDTSQSALLASGAGTAQARALASSQAGITAGANQALAQAGAAAQQQIAAINADETHWQAALDAGVAAIQNSQDAQFIAMQAGLNAQLAEQIQSDEEKKTDLLAALKDQTDAIRQAQQEQVKIAQDAAKQQQAAAAPSSAGSVNWPQGVMGVTSDGRVVTLPVWSIPGAIDPSTGAPSGSGGGPSPYSALFAGTPPGNPGPATGPGNQPTDVTVNVHLSDGVLASAMNRIYGRKATLTVRAPAGGRR